MKSHLPLIESAIIVLQKQRNEECLQTIISVMIKKLKLFIILCSLFCMFVFTNSTEYCAFTVIILAGSCQRMNATDAVHSTAVVFSDTRAPSAGGGGDGSPPR